MSFGRRILRALRMGFGAATEGWGGRFVRFWTPRLGILIGLLLLALWLKPDGPTRAAYCSLGFTSYCDPKVTEAAELEAQRQRNFEESARKGLLTVPPYKPDDPVIVEAIRRGVIPKPTAPQ